MPTAESELFFSEVFDISKSHKVHTERHTFAEIANALKDSGHEVFAVKAKASAYNFADYAGKGRLKENVKVVSAAVLDIDTISVEAFHALRNKLKEFKSLCYTTYSYLPAKPKVRVIVPFRQAVSGTRYAEQVRRLGRMLGVEYDQVASENANAVFFLPSRPEGEDVGHFIECHIDPDFLDFDALPPAQASQSQKRSSNVDSDEKNYYDMAAEAQASMYPDGLVFVNGEFYCYRDGFWTLLPILNMKKAFSRKASPLHDALASPAAMNNLVEALKAHTHMDAFPDATPLTVCVKNGVVDLNTGSAREHASTHWHRNRLEIDYYPDASCSRWLAFLADTFSPDKDRTEKIAYLQELMGYILIPSCKYHAMTWFIGNGANGKSVAIKTIQAMLGKENYSTVPMHHLGQPFKNSVIQNKLANFCSEISVKRAVDEGAIKEIVGGDAIYAEKKGKDGFSFEPYARILAAGNALPDMSDTSDGFSRRLTILNFNRRILDEEMDRDLGTKLLEELPGILAWAIAGLQRLRTTGKLTVVPSSVTAVSAYKMRSNPVAQFMETVAEVGDTRQCMKSTDVYRNFENFCKENGFVPVMANSKFGVELARLGVESKKSNGKHFYLVKLRAERPETNSTHTGPVTKPPKKRSLSEELGLDEAEAEAA